MALLHGGLHRVNLHLLNWLQLDYCYQGAKARFLQGIDRTEPAVRLLMSQREERKHLLDLLRDDLVVIDDVCATLYTSIATQDQSYASLDGHNRLVGLREIN